MNDYKKYLLSLALVLFSLLCLLLVAEYFVRMIPNEYSFKYDKITNSAGNYRIIILGSSHTFHGVNPEYFDEPALNIANVGQDLKYDSYLLKKSLSTLSNITTVILPISYFSLFKDLDSETEYWRKYYYIHWMDYPILELFDINNYSVIISHPKKIALLNAIYHYFLKKDFKLSLSDSGWRIKPLDETQADLVLTGKRTAEQHSMKNTFYDRNLMLLNGIVALCQAKKITLLLFTPPAYITYREHLNQQRLNQTIALSETIARENNNVDYINLIADSRFVQKDFSDADHLNRAGAKKLSIILNEYLNKKL